MRRIREINKNTAQEWEQLYIDPEIATRWTQWFDGSLVESVIANIPRRAMTLDVGCGVGFSQYVIQKIKKRTDVRWFGVDRSENAIDYLRKHSSVKWEGFLCWNALDDLPFRDKFFDVAMACEILEHLENPELLVAELVRAAKTVIITVPNRLMVDSEYHIWEFDIHDVVDLLSKYGQTTVRLARQDCQIVGVCQCK